tara:strand:- start:783 stop:1658 length:876 start_codon:yes stop_codon:yes gene_type:complete
MIKSLKFPAIFLLILFSINFTLYYKVPSFFEVDLAKGPYTVANNLELTRVYVRAIPKYEKVIENFPNSKYAILSRIGIANCLKGSDSIAKALEIYYDLLIELKDTENFNDYRYSILKSLSDIYRNNNNLEDFQKIYNQLVKSYPDSQATIEGKLFLVSEKEKSQSIDNFDLADLSIMIESEKIIFPEKTKIGSTENIKIPIKIKDKSMDFIIVSDMNFWKGFEIIKIVPNPNTITEAWGKRNWQFSSKKDEINLELVVTAKKKGSYNLDIDAESMFEMVELGILKQIIVSD